MRKISTCKRLRVRIIHVSQEFASGLTSLLLEKKILLAKVCKCTKKLTSSPGHGVKENCVGRHCERDLKQRERWRRTRKKWQPEVYISSLSVLWLDKFVQRELKQRHPDSLCETESFHQTRHLTSRCYSWHPGRHHCAGCDKVLRVGVEPATLVKSATPPRYQLYGLIRDMFCICRACGQVFCRDCTKQKIPLPQFGYMNPERVCENCYQRNTIRQADEEVGLCLCFSVRPGTVLFNFWSSVSFHCVFALPSS